MSNRDDRTANIAFGLAAIGLLALVLSGHVSYGPATVSAQQAGIQTVRFAVDDAIGNQVIAQLQTLTKALTVTAAVRAPIGSNLNRPVGQIGDALKVAIVGRADPCSTIDKGDVAISQTATTRLVVGQPGMRVFVCAARIVAGVAEIPSFTEGTGAACATGTTAVSGSTTAANGESYAANGGFSGGNGSGSIMVTNKPGDDLCLQQSGANRLAGNLVYAFGAP